MLNTESIYKWRDSIRKANNSIVLAAARLNVAAKILTRANVLKFKTKSKSTLIVIK